MVGQVVDVYGGDTVHYEADAGYTGHAYSGYLKGGFTFAPLIAWNGDSRKQRVGTWITEDPIQTTFLNADFRAQLGSLKLRKTDKGGKLLDGAVFHVSGNGYDRDVTVTNGEITVNELPIGDYTVTEKTAPNGYLVNVAPFKTTVSANHTAETTITDEAPTGKISIKKSDSKGNVQGEASLEGAEYTVYGADGREVGKITTDKDGNGSLENLVLGTYTVKETKAPEAYDLDWNTYTVELTYKDQNTAIILGNVDSKENVKTGKIEIKKTDTEGNPAAVLILEELEHARARGPRSWARSPATAPPATPTTSPPPTRRGAWSAACMEQALADAGLAPEAVDYINAHGTSTPSTTAGETAAIRRVFGAHADRLMVSSTKSMTGHLLGASGAVEAALCVLALKDGFVPATINYQVPDPACDLDIVPNEGREADIRCAISILWASAGTTPAWCSRSGRAETWSLTPIRSRRSCPTARPFCWWTASPAESPASGPRASNASL